MPFDFTKTKILFAGTPDICLPTLDALQKSGAELMVLTAPDKAQSRSKDLVPSQVKAWALAQSLPCISPEQLDEGVRATIRAFEPDYLISFAYGKIFGPKFLALFPKGTINIHPSKLPLLRGPSPIASSILLGFDKTALTFQSIGLAMDEGDIILQVPLDIGIEMHTRDLEVLFSQLAAEHVLQALELVASGAKFEPQDASLASYCSMIQKSDGLVDWKLSAFEIHNKIRAFSTWPQAKTRIKGLELSLLSSQLTDESSFETPGKVLRIDKTLGMMVQTGKGCIWIQEVQLTGKRAMTVKDFANGMRDLQGSILGAISG